MSIDIVAKIPEKLGGPFAKAFYFSVYDDDIAEAAAKIINDCGAVEEGTVIDALLDLATKKIQQYGLPDPDRVMRFVLGFDEFYSALENEFMLQKTERAEMKDRVFEINFTYRAGNERGDIIQDGLGVLETGLESCFVDALINEGVIAVKRLLRDRAKVIARRQNQEKLDWYQITFEDSADEFIYEITKRALGWNTEKTPFESVKTDDFDHLFKPVNFRIEKPAFFGASLNYRAGTVEGQIERVFLLPPGLSEECMKRFCCSEIKREVRAMHNTCDFMVTHFVGGLIE